MNSGLVNEVESLPYDDQTSLVFGPDNLKTLIDAQKERSSFEKLAAERPAKRQKTNQRPYHNPRENTTYRPNQFFRGGSTEAQASVEPIRGNPAHPTSGDPTGAIPLAITGTRAPKPIKLNVLSALRNYQWQADCLHFRHNWTLISAPNNVLDYIEGLTLPLTSEPIPTMNEPLCLYYVHTLATVCQDISRLESININYPAVTWSEASPARYSWG